MKNKWPKELPPLTIEQQHINDDFMKYWHEILATQVKFNIIEYFNHTYSIKHVPHEFVRTLEIGAGMGEHLAYEKLTPLQKKNYVALELRNNMAEAIKKRHSDIQTSIGDCQTRLDFPDDYFDRILAIHVLEHLPNLPMTVKEMHRLCNKKNGHFSVVIPCEGGYFYTLARKISAQRLFEKRYKQSYRWFIEREHINKPKEIIHELECYFLIKQKSFFPFMLPSINMNLCIGLTLMPKVIP